MERAGWLIAILFLAAGSASAQVETVHPGDVLDPSRAVKSVSTVAGFHLPLAEQYIWPAGNAAVVVDAKQLSLLKRNDWKVEPHAFRREFSLATQPAKATLYIAGPRLVRVWINGVLVAQLQYVPGHHAGFGVLHADIAACLRAGKNLIAIEAVRGYGSHHHTNALKTSWLNSGEVLAVKLLGDNGRALLTSDQAWKSAVSAKEGWQKPNFDDSAWSSVVSLGGIESSVDFFQWNADAGMYDWPGYLGEAPYMANFFLDPASSRKISEGTLLDFGRELNGRLILTVGHATVRMGESLGELLHAPYLGEIALSAAPGKVARGPKTGFRYALVHGDRGVKVVAEGIYYPVPQIGSFESSDERVNKIFATAAYTAHLSMQDSILDGIKRDRGRWIGDDEVINRSVLDLYADSRLIKAGLEDGIGPEPVTQHVNGLPGYSAWWVVAEYEYIQRFGDLDQLRSLQQRMEELLALMAKELDDRNVYAGKVKPFVDWSPGFSTDTPEARRAVHFEYLLAFRRASALFADLHDQANYTRYKSLADSMAEAASKYLEDPDGSFGDRWQTNAIAYLANAGWPPHKVPDTSSVWYTLKRTTTGRKPTDIITPYFGDYVLQAMSAIGGAFEPMQWMKSYWGGMLDTGATSFWEAWDPSWAGPDPHSKLQADDKVGYNASLSHGWSSGPVSFLLEDVLGIKPASPGYASVYIAPQLAGLEWMKGSVATPLGPVRVEAAEQRVLVKIPSAMKGSVLLYPVRKQPGGSWTRDGMKLEVGPGVALWDNGCLNVDLKPGERNEFLWK